MNNSAQFLARAARWSRGMNRMVKVTALAVVLITAYILMRPAITAEGSLICGFEEHTHNEQCYETVIEYEPVLVCPLPEISGHIHDDTCCDADGNLICDVQYHQHDESCYIMEETETVRLVCEIPEHTHTGECFDIGPMTLDSDGTYEHTHTDECFRGGVLVCTLAETAEKVEDIEIIPEDTDELLTDGIVVEDFMLADQELAIGEGQMKTLMSINGHSSSEDNPLTMDDYWGAITATLDESVIERLLRDELFQGKPSFSFTLTIYNEQFYWNDSWFEYKIGIPSDWWEEHPKAYLSCTADQDNNRIEARGNDIGEWELTDHNSIRCHFNENSQKYYSILMRFTLTLYSGEDSGYEFDMNQPFVLVKKLDAYSGKPLSGVTIALFDEDGNILESVVTDDDGVAFFDGSNLSVYEPYYFQEMYDDPELPEYLSAYARDESKRWFLSIPGDTVWDFVADEYAIIQEEHPGIITITDSMRQHYREGTDAFEILNYPCYTLPETGGRGAILCYLSGIAILTAAAIVWKRKKESVTPPPRILSAEINQFINTA